MSKNIWTWMSTQLPPVLRHEIWAPKCQWALWMRQGFAFTAILLLGGFQSPAARRLSMPRGLSTRSINPSAPKCPRSTFMQHYQVPSAEYSSYINHVISLGLAEDYTAQLRASCSPNSPPSLRAAIDQACRHLSGVVDDLQPVPASAPGVHSLETLGQQNGAPVSDAAVGLAAAMPNTPEEQARILQLTQLINARHGAAKPQNTVQAEKSAAKLWKVGAAWPSLLFLWRP